MATETERKIVNFGIVGIGVGGAEILPAMESHSGLQLVAGCDVNPRVLTAFKERYEARGYDTMEGLCADPDVDVIYVSTPNQFHARHTIMALNAGKHVAVEKPMAISMQEAEQMNEAADRNNRLLMCAHTQSFSPEIGAMRRIIASGELGQLRALHIMAYSDWMMRPRSDEELDPNQGGGVPYRQGPHQLDTVRLLGGGMVKSVRGMTGGWFKARPIQGYFTAYLEFEDGTPCTVVHNGYGYFNTNELLPWGKEAQNLTPEQRIRNRKALQDGTWDQNQGKDAIRIGGPEEMTRFRRGGERQPWLPGDLGFVIASCDGGDIRHSDFGLYVYDGDGKREVPVPGQSAMRATELEEIYNSIALGAPVYHDGKWGMGTLEVCLAILESGLTHKEIELTHQVPVPAGYDEMLRAQA